MRHSMELGILAYGEREQERRRGRDRGREGGGGTGGQKGRDGDGEVVGSGQAKRRILRYDHWNNEIEDRLAVNM